MIKNDISNLPRPERDEGLPPVSNNVIAETLANAWFQRYIDRGNAERSRALPELPYRASYASKRCNRQLFYALSDTPESEPLTPASAWTMGLGTMVHDHLQNVIEQTWPDAECEPTVDLRPIGIPGSGHADVVLRNDDTLVEVKTTGGFSFKMMATSFKGVPQGPRFPYLLQAAMLAAALNIKKIVIALLSLEPVSPQLADTYAQSDAGRFAAEWHYMTDDLMPFVDAERERINNILAAVGREELPARVIVDPEFAEGATVTAPMAARAPWVVYSDDRSTIVDSGSYWGCAYCPWRSKCHEDGE